MTKKGARRRRCVLFSGLFHNISTGDETEEDLLDEIVDGRGNLTVRHSGR